MGIPTEPLGKSDATTAITDLPAFRICGWCGGIIGAADPLLSRPVVSEMDWTFAYQMNRHTAFILGYSHFFRVPSSKNLEPPRVSISHI